VIGQEGAFPGDAGQLTHVVGIVQQDGLLRGIVFCLQIVVEIKEIRLSPNIDTNDLNTKVAAARKFLSKGDRVKLTLRFRGREMAHMSASKHILDDVAEMLSDIANVEKAAKVEGRTMTMFLSKK
jgi:translation initiation factor IF-3